MLKRNRIEQIFRTRLGLDPGRMTIRTLAGDASNRRYHRLEFPPESSPASMILMELADPEPFKQSEEKVSGSDPAAKELPFINVLRYLASLNLPVPDLYYHDEEGGLLFLQDLGDTTLEEEVRSAGEEDTRTYYLRAIDELVKMQAGGPADQNPGCIAFDRGFDVPLLMWEFDHFLEYGIEARTGEKIRDADRKVIQAGFQKICNAVMEAPPCFVHRDYHSRNIMIHNKDLWIIDFQDALAGPATYDLASLLRDSYTVLPEPLLSELIQYYLERKNGKTGQKNKTAGEAEFRKLFDWMSIQRNLKAAGRFVYIEKEKNKDHLLRYIPQTLGYVKRNLENYPELRSLREALIPYVGELQ